MSILHVPATAPGKGSPVEENNEIETGTDKAYEFLNGGIPKGKSLVYYAQPGVEGETFWMRTAYSTLKRGGTCIFIASSTSPAIIRNQFKESGWNIEPFRSRFFFVDAYSPLIGAQPREKYAVSNPENISDFSRAITCLLKESPASTVIFGSLSTIMDLCGEEETIEAVKTWNRTAELYGHVLIYNFTAWPYSQDTLSAIKKNLFNAVVCIGGITKRTIFSGYFDVIKSDWLCEKRNICVSGLLAFVPVLMFLTDIARRNV